jgi:hypothetical protein
VRDFEEQAIGWWLFPLCDPCHHGWAHSFTRYKVYQDYWRNHNTAQAEWLLRRRYWTLRLIQCQWFWWWGVMPLGAFVVTLVVAIALR